MVDLILLKVKGTYKVVVIETIFFLNGEEKFVDNLSVSIMAARSR